MCLGFNGLRAVGPVKACLVGGKEWEWGPDGGYRVRGTSVGG